MWFPFDETARQSGRVLAGKVVPGGQEEDRKPEEPTSRTNDRKSTNDSTNHFHSTAPVCHLWRSHL